MSFAWPALLASIALVPIGILAFRAVGERRRRRAAALGGFGLSGPTDRESPGLRVHVPPLLFIAAFTTLAIAMARPQAALPLPRAEGTVILTFDVSASMQADDLVPTRMEAAKAAAKALVESQPSGVVIGVVAFSDAGLTVQAPSRDKEIVLAAIDRLAPTRGTSLGQGILAALDAITRAEADTPPEYYSNRSPDPGPSPTPVKPGSHDSAVIVVLSDGENNQSPDPLAAAQAAADQGVPIVAVGMGSTAGAVIDLDGFEVHTRLEEATLRQIADVSDGTYYAADETAELSGIYETLGTRLVVKSEPIELTGLLAGAAVLLLLIGGVLSLAWSGRVP